MDFSAIGAITSNLNAATSMVKGILDLRTDAAVTARTTELRLVLVNAMEKMGELRAEVDALERVNAELEKEIARLKQFDMDAVNYQLQAVGPGAFVYVLKTQANEENPPCWLCAHCVSEKVHSVLQFAKSTRDGRIYVCPRCKGEIVVAHDPSESSIQTIPRNRDGAW